MTLTTHTEQDYDRAYERVRAFNALVSKLGPTFAAMTNEILDARAKHGDQKHLPLINCRAMQGAYAFEAQSCKNAWDEAFERGEGSWDIIFLEEVFEALEALQDGDLAEGRKELLQVLAMAASMIELIDERSAE